MYSGFLDWFEEHKVGIIGTLTLHTLVLFIFFLLRLPPPPQLAVIPEMQVEIMDVAEVEQMLERMVAGETAVPEKVTNLTSNIAAELRPSFNRERLAANVEEAIAGEAQAEFDRLRQERMERGETDPVMPQLDPSKWDKDLYMDKAAEPARVEGATTVSHDLKDPLRAEQYIHVPAYICKGFGHVVVNVSVDRIGNVRKAEIDVARTMVSEECMVEAALRSAQGARFAPNGSAPDPQRGSIYYRFMPQ